ncbi:MAG: hypothetical protein ACRYGR_03505 [Janthinobacterium lividum]
MNFNINKKVLTLLVFGHLVIINSTQASSLFGTTSVKDLIQTVINKGQNALCRESGEFRKSKGDVCKKDPTMARLALVACTNVEDFNKSGCYDKAITRLGYASVESAKQDIIKELSNSTYNDFFCGAARSKFTGHLKEIADQCKNNPALPHQNEQQKSDSLTRPRSNAFSNPIR